MLRQGQAFDCDIILAVMGLGCEHQASGYGGAIEAKSIETSICCSCHPSSLELRAAAVLFRYTAGAFLSGTNVIIISGV